MASNKCCEGAQATKCAAKPGYPACDTYSKSWAAGCNESIELQLKGKRNRWGFVENATLGLVGNCTYCLDAPHQDVCETCRDLRVQDIYGYDASESAKNGRRILYLWTLEEAAKICDANAIDFGSGAQEYAGVIVESQPQTSGPNEGKYKCFFVSKDFAPLEYRKAEAGVMARLRNEAPFNIPHCMKLCNVNERGLLTEHWTGNWSFCQDFAQAHCSKAENTTSDWCKDFYASYTGDGDAILKKHCQKVYEGAKRNVNKASTKNQELCACFWPDQVYKDYFNQPAWKNIPKLVQDQACAYPGCAGGRFRPLVHKNGTKVCPKVEQCLAICDIVAGKWTPKQAGGSCDQVIDCFNGKQTTMRGARKKKSRSIATPEKVESKWEWVFHVLVLGFIFYSLVF